MIEIQTWGSAISDSLIVLYSSFANFLPTFIGAILVFLIGLIIAKVLGDSAEKGIRMIKVDKTIEKTELAKHFQEIGMELSLSKIIGTVVKWFLILVFLMVATDILQLTQVTTFLYDIIGYMPKIAVSVVIMAIALLLANFTYKLVRGSVKAAGVMSASILASISKWAILIFGIMVALGHLGIADQIVVTLFTGLIAAISLAIGLSFGLGGKDEAALILRKLREELVDRK